MNRVRGSDGRSLLSPIGARVRSLNAEIVKRVRSLGGVFVLRSVVQRRARRGRDLAGYTAAGLPIISRTLLTSTLAGNGLLRKPAFAIALSIGASPST